MSVSCNFCGAVASYGREISHKSDCPSACPPMRTTIPPDIKDRVAALERQVRSIIAALRAAGIQTEEGGK